MYTEAGRTQAAWLGFRKQTMWVWPVHNGSTHTHTPSGSGTVSSDFSTTLLLFDDFVLEVLISARLDFLAFNIYLYSVFYLVSANEENGQVSTNSCSGNTEWKSLDTTRKRFFRRRLRKLCA